MRRPAPAAPEHGQDGRSAGRDAETRDLLRIGSLWPKLTVGATGDPLEIEADQTADRILRMPAEACTCGDTCSGCPSGEPHDEGVVQRKPAGKRTPQSPSVPDGFVRDLGPGRPLDPSTRTFFEPRFGRDFGAIRLHTGPDAARAAASIGARAFTAGTHIAFADRAGDRSVLAHELAHVVQQGDRRTSAVQRVGPEDPPFGYFPAERELIKRAEAERRAEEAKHRAWVASHKAEHGKYLSTVAGGRIEKDIETTKGQIVEQRMALFGEIARQPKKPDPFAGLGARFRMQAGPVDVWGRAQIPPELADKWALAQQAVVVVEALLTENQLTPEDAATARWAFLDFFQTLLPVVEEEDRKEAERARIFQGFERPAPPTLHCPGSCHAPSQPSPRTVRPAPQPNAPRLRDIVEVASRARTEGEWRQAIQRFQTATSILDSILLASVPTDSSAREGFVYAQGLLERQEALHKSQPNALRIAAVFYPEDKLVDVEGAGGKKDQVAAGIPWYFYLTHSDTPDDYRYPAGFEWVLQDITSPKRPTVRYPLTGPEIFTREYAHLHVNEPPPALFRKLNNELIFPEGMLYWTYPTGAPGQLETTEPWSVSTWLTAIGIGIAGLALILASGGLATPGVLAGLGVASAAFGIASTLSDLHEKSELGILTEEDKNKAILFIAADLVSALSAGLSSAAAKAGEAAALAGRATRMTVLIQRTATGVSAVDKWFGKVVMVTVAADFVQQYQAIQHSNLSGPEREKALRRLALTGLLTGGMTVAGHVLGRGPKEEPHAPGRAGAQPEPPGIRAPHAEGEVITVKGHTTEPAPGWSKPKQESEFLDWSRQQETLKPDQAAHEFQLAQTDGKRRATPENPHHSEVIEHNGHTWEKRRDGRGWCRSSPAKVCYTKLTVGVEGEAERVSPMTTVTEVRKFLEKELAQRPKSAAGEQGRLDWTDYSFYANRRLVNIAEAIAAGKTPPPPPRTFKSFLQAHPPGSPVRNEIRASRFEKKVEGVFKKVVAPERIELVKVQHNISESTSPPVRKGELTRPDVMFPSSEVPGWTAVTDKSRASLVDATPVTARSQARADLHEAVEKYSGVQQVRKTGEEVDLTRVWLMYDGAQVPPRLRPAIEAEVRAFQRQYKATGLVFEVFFVRP
jgi:hypothetical protein